MCQTMTPVIYYKNVQGPLIPVIDGHSLLLLSNSVIYVVIGDDLVLLGTAIFAGHCSQYPSCYAYVCATLIYNQRMCNSAPMVSSVNI